MENVQPYSHSQKPYLAHKLIFLIIISFVVALICGILGYIFGINTVKNETKLYPVVPTSAHTASKAQPTLAYLEAGGRPTDIPMNIIPTVANYVTPTPDPITANWKTYTNNTVGYTLLYPPNWQVETEPSYFPDENSVRFTVNQINSTKDPIVFSIIVTKNTAIRNPEIDNGVGLTKIDNISLSQWFHGIASGLLETQPTQVIIDGFPAIKTKFRPDIENYLVIAPGLQTTNAEYSIVMGGTGGDSSGLKNPYNESDLFVKEELINFHRVVASIRFPK